MAYNLVTPARQVVAAPTVNTDSTQGYAAGHEVVVTTATPRTIYKCTNPAAGAAVWVLLGSAGLVALLRPEQFDEMNVLAAATAVFSSTATIGGP